MPSNAHQPPRGLTGPADTCPPCLPSDAPDLASDPSAPSAAGAVKWQPVPQPVVDAILGAGHNLHITPHWHKSDGWRWGDAGHEPATWVVDVGDVSFRGGSGRATSYCAVTPRAGILSTLAQLASIYASQSTAAATAAKRARDTFRKKRLAEHADGLKAKSAATLDLAEKVAALWPEVSP